MIAKKLLTVVALGLFGQGCIFVGRVAQTFDMGRLYRMAELGDEKAVELLEYVSEYATQLDENLTVLKKRIRR